MFGRRSEANTVRQMSRYFRTQDDSSDLWGLAQVLDLIFKVEIWANVSEQLFPLPYGVSLHQIMH